MAMKLHACGCVLAEGQRHYCGRGEAILLPRPACKHEHWDHLHACCAQCGALPVLDFGLGQ